jgi:hypothetical protein
MARSHSTKEASWTNPEVRFERSDVEYRGVVMFGVILALALVVIVPSMFWLGRWLVKTDVVETDRLPPAAIHEADRLPPDPRLEYVQKGQPRVTPPRAGDILANQRQLLDKGDPKRGIQPIAEALDALAGKLPAQKDRAAPTNFSPRLPSKATSGRRDTGGL